jgi:hypothetical protein
MKTNFSLYLFLPALFLVLTGCLSFNPRAGFFHRKHGHTYHWRESFDRDLDQQLVLAVMNGRLGEAEDLIAQGAEVNAQGEAEATPLIMCLFAQKYSGFRFLLDQGADPNTQHEILEAPIYLAAKMGDQRFLKKILEAGADPNVRIRNGGPYLLQDLAVRAPFSRLELLISHGADLDFYETPETHIILAAVQRGQYIRARLFLELGSRLLEDEAVLKPLLRSINESLEAGSPYSHSTQYLMRLASYLVYEMGLPVQQLIIPEALRSMLREP